MKKTTIIIFVFTLFFVSCGTDEVPFEHKYVIDVVLKPDVKFQRAFVDSTYRLDSYLDPVQTGISGAEIFIVNENSDTFTYSESDTMIGLYYSNDSFCVEYSMKYSVNVSVEGEFVNREVQVPGPLDIFSPDDLDTVSLSDPPLLIWNTCEYCFENTYLITSYIDEETDSSEDYEYLPMLTTDTTMGIFSSVFLFKTKDTTYRVLVEAMDFNVYNFAQMWVEYEELGEETIGLIGAISSDTVAVWVQE